MTPEQFRKIDEIFNTARMLARGERTAFLNQTCASDTALRSEVEALLSADEEPDRYLRTPAIQQGAHIASIGGRISAAPLPTPAQIGKYRILRVLGEGGFGVVYLAEQESPRRTVAIKVLKSQFATPQVLRRFEYEAQVLGRLQHQGIAQIFEAGTSHEGGRLLAYFVMEHIEGLPLDRFTREKNLNVRQRLELFARVCDAVQYAHQKGILHRDLKPGNILVVEDDDTRRYAVSLDGSRPAHTMSLLNAQPKILDFGVARATDANEQITTMRTSTGQFIGTLPYMSPEQVSGDPREVDTRSDVYSLGVVLYQLLSGVLPLDFKSCSVPEAARKIRDDEPRRLGTLDRGFRGEIEIIVSKAMDKERNRRYQSALDLSSDIRRYLAGEPIEARRDSTFYVLRKALRRYRSVVAVICLFAFALAGFSVYAYVQSERNRQLAHSESAARIVADNARRTAESAQKRADLAAQQLRYELAISRIERGRMSARAGNEADAERLLWAEYLQFPQSPDAYWALWELYQQHPWVASTNQLASPASAASIHPDSTKLAVLSADGSITIATLPMLTPMRRIPAHSSEGRTIAFSQDGALAASGANDGSILVWDTDSWTQVREICAAPDAIRWLTFSPDSTRIVSADQGGWVRVHDAATGAALHGTRDHTWPAYRVVYSPDGRYLASSGNDGRIVIRDAETMVPVTRIRSATGSISSAVFSPDGAQYVGATDRRVTGWNTVTGQAEYQLYAPNGAIGALAFTPDGARLAVSGYWRIDFWNHLTQTREYHISAPQTPSACGVTNDGRWLVMTSGAMIRVWELNRRPGTIHLPSENERTVVAMTPDGRLVATGDSTGRMFLWDGRTGEKLNDWLAHRGRIRSIRFHPTRPLLLTNASEERRLIVWDLRDGSRFRDFTCSAPQTSKSFDISPDGTRLALADRDGAFCIMDLESGGVIHKLWRTGFECISIVFSNDGRRVVCVTREAAPHKVVPRIFDVDTGEALVELQCADKSLQWTFAFSHDDRIIASGDWDRHVNLFDAETGALRTSMTGHAALVLDVKYHPQNPNLLFSTAGDGSLRIWDTQSRRSMMAIEPFEGWEVMNLEFTRDGSVMVAGGMYGGTRIWELAYFDRHIAGNLEFMYERMRDTLAERPDPTPLREWAARVMARPWPQQRGTTLPDREERPVESPGGMVTPAEIRNWPTTRAADAPTRG